MEELRTKSQLISPKEVAELLGRSDRWVYEHWEELGGTKAFGGLRFFREIIYERIQTARSEAEAMVLRIQEERDSVSGKGLRDSKRSSRGGSRNLVKGKERNDPFGVFGGS